MSLSRAQPRGREPRCIECRRPQGEARVLLKLRRGHLCDRCVESAVRTLRAVGIDLTVLCPLCPRKYGADDEPRAGAEDVHG
jgi:hypothetical protein